MSPNRVAVYLTAAGGLATAVAVPLAELDATSTAGVIAGLAAVLGVVHTWLRGWQAHEHRQAEAERPKGVNVEVDAIPVDPHDHSEGPDA